MRKLFREVFGNYAKRIPADAIVEIRYHMDVLLADNVPAEQSGWTTLTVRTYDTCCGMPHGYEPDTSVCHECFEPWTYDHEMRINGQPLGVAWELKSNWRDIADEQRKNN